MGVWGKGKTFFLVKKSFSLPPYSVYRSQTDYADREQQDLQYEFAWGEQTLSHILHALIEKAEWCAQG